MEPLPFVIAFLSILLGLLGGRMLQELLEHILSKPQIKRTLEMNESTGVFIANGTKYVVYFFAFLLAIYQFPVGDFVLNIAGVFMIISFLIIILYSIKEFIQNSLSGFLIMRQKIFVEGDFVEISGVKGKITKVNLVFTEIELEDKSLVILPNSSIVNRKIIKRQSD